MTTFTDRIAIVTGGSRGIGRAIALELGKGGATVLVNYNSSAAAAEEVAAAITAAGGRGEAIQADVADPAQAEKLIDYAKTTYGKLDVLVNNAGTTRDNLIARMKLDDFDAVLNTNLRSAWVMCKAASRVMMRARYGRIINITSVSGISGQAGQTNYSASKAGLIGLTKSLAREVASRNVTVNAVAPGFIETDMTKDLPEEIVKNLNSTIPMERWGKAEEIAYAVAFLAGEQASYITGAVLSVDGGLVMG
ncbi:MAG: 3-oxoacyl-[acyl-carrier-protein] reductase [Phototrophicaceae bacterium]|jgi:3-oxoacyl-[acyl-carrier protein] reductase